MHIWQDDNKPFIVTVVCLSQREDFRVTIHSPTVQKISIATKYEGFGQNLDSGIQSSVLLRWDFVRCCLTEENS